MKQDTVRLSFTLGQIRLVYNGDQNNVKKLHPSISLSACLSVRLSGHSSACPCPPRGACRLINLGKAKRSPCCRAPNQSADESTTLSGSSDHSLCFSLSLSLLSLSLSPCWPHTQLSLWQFKNHIKLVSKKSPQRNHQQIISN